MLASSLFMSLCLLAGKPVAKPELPMTDAIRIESEVVEAGQAAIARYEDRQLAPLGFLDVTKAPYNADCSGKTDATAALQQAMRETRN